MSLLGKNYDEEISKIIKQLNENTKNINELITSFNNLQKVLGGLQESIITLAKVQSQHKETITFLLNNITFNAEDTENIERVQKELVKMISNIRKTEEEIK